MGLILVLILVACMLHYVHTHYPSAPHPVRTRKHTR